MQREASARWGFVPNTSFPGGKPHFSAPAWKRETRELNQVDIGTVDEMESPSPRRAKGEMDMKKFAMLRTLLLDEAGGEVLEYALIAGLIIVGAIALITSVGTKVVARWTSLNGSM
jgi:Flp pilus assembly pilin Flp